MKKKKILITGSSGQIGTNLGLELLKRGHEVFGIDIRPNTWTNKINTTLQDLSLPYNEHKKGIGNIVYPENLDIVVHLAAHAKVYELVKNPLKAIENVMVTFNVLEYCRNNKIPIIFSSSREVYGDIYRYLTNEEQTNIYFTESPYSASKISSEAFIYSYAQCYDINYIIFRFSNVYGRYDNDIDRMERVIPLFIQKIKDDQPITVFGKDKVLDFTYIDDCIQGIVSAIELLTNNQKVNQTINLAYGKGNTLVKLAEYIGEALEKKPKINISNSKIGEVTYYVADIAKARKLLNYNPQTDLKEGILKTVQWVSEWEKKNKH
jgi:UDP-glucose 4-epimerase